MDEQKRAGFVATAEKIKGAAMCLIGVIIAYMAIDNYIKVSNAIIGTTIRMPRILEWAYDTLGLIPAVALQILLGLALAGYGIYKIRTGK